MFDTRQSVWYTEATGQVCGASSVAHTRQPNATRIGPFVYGSAHLAGAV